MAASITVHLQIFKRQQLSHFLTDSDETEREETPLHTIYCTLGNIHGCKVN